MPNYVTQAELDKARESYADLSGEQIEMIREEMAEQAVGRNVAGHNYGLSPAVVEESGEGVSSILYEIVYRARVAKLFTERDNVNA